MPDETLTGKELLLEKSIRQMIDCLEDYPEREGLVETPRRARKAWQFWTEGYGKDPEEILKVFKDGSEFYDQMVYQGGIPVYSHCEHHLAPFFGKAYIAYLPSKGVVGLSKLSRLVDVFARRLQVQERLTQQVARALQQCLEPLGVAVVVECRHLCMESRGIQRIGTTTTTSAMTGVFQTDAAAKAEFFEFVNRERT